LSTVVGIVVGGVAAAFVVRALVQEWPRVSREVAHAHVGWLVLALVAASAAIVDVAWGWRYVLRTLGSEVAPRRVVPWFLVGEVAKYVPGGVWSVMGRGELANRGGVGRRRAYVSVALSLVTAYLAAMVVAAVFLPFAADGATSWYGLCLLVLPLGVIGLHPRVLSAVFALASRLLRRQLDLPVPTWRESLLLVARYIPAWLLVGTATWAVARSITADVSFPRVVFAAVLSWVVGFLAVPVPSGAGVREAVFLATSGLPRDRSVYVAVTARLVFVVVDVGGALFGLRAVRSRVQVGR
jgi:uncharacterized membrane protein YbhN (UPF0104 family)